MESDPKDNHHFLSLTINIQKFPEITHIMDRLAQHFLNRPSRDAYPTRSHFGPPLVETLAKSFVKRAMAGEEKRGRTRRRKAEDVNLQRLGEFMIDMFGEKGEGRRGFEESGSRERRRGLEFENGSSERRRGDGEGRRRRRRRRYSEDEELFENSREEEPREEESRDININSVNPNYPYIHIPQDPQEPSSSSYPISSRRRHRSHRPDFTTLKTELETMSDTLTDLNERSPSHPDCEFYNKFVDRGGQLQVAIGETLGQIREAEERSERRRKRRRRRE